MIPRTTHFVLGVLGFLVFALVCVIQIGGGTTSAQGNTVGNTSPFNNQIASVGASVSAESEKSRVREQLVTALTEQLSTEPVIEVVEVVEEEVQEVPEEIPSSEVVEEGLRVRHEAAKNSLYACLEEFTPYSGGTTFFGDAITMRVAEGARIVSVDVASGTPVYFSRTLQLPEIPVLSRTPACLPEGVIGIATHGALMHSGETIPYAQESDGLVGYAADGFGIFGMTENGVAVTNDELDVCHGHTHAIMWDGVQLSQYHYHVNDEFPYTLGCFRGTPTSIIE